MAGTVLWHIEVSHYNEKARWALDLKGVPHRRRAPMPGVLHPVVALAKTRKPYFPVLEYDGEAIPDSTRIIEELERRHPSPSLYPEDPAQRARALELEDWFDEEVGPYVRRWVFYRMSQDGESAADGLRLFGLPSVPKPIAEGMLRGVARRYGGSDSTIELARERTRQGVEKIEAELQPSGYLVGDSFSVADLTAASLLLHMVRPPEFQYELPVYPESIEEFRASLPERGVEWIREMWRRHRPASAEV